MTAAANPGGEQREVAGFAERLLDVIDAGRRVATYKLAVLLALMDLCASHSGDDGTAPTLLHTRDVAEVVVALYWPQVSPLALGPRLVPLRQITSPKAAIIEAVRGYKELATADGVASLHQARQRLGAEYERVVDRVEVTVAREPLPRLQTVGSSSVAIPFLYDLDWTAGEAPSLRRLRAYGPRGAPIRLHEGAGDQLVRLAPLVRPLVELHWTRWVAVLSGVATEEEQLHRHLFGSERVLLPAHLRGELLDLQRGQCFYCGEDIRSRSDADHFVARVRGGSDALENLVLADPKCNGDKSDLLAAPALVERWTNRNSAHAVTLSSAAYKGGWETDRVGVTAVARSIYGHLPSPSAFWLGWRNVVRGDPAPALAALAQRPYG